MQCCGSMTFRCGSGSADPCLWLMDPDADPDSAIFVIDLQDANKKLIKKFFFAYYFLKVHLHHFGSVTEFFLQCWNFQIICGGRNRVGIGLACRPASRLHILVGLITFNQLLGSLSWIIRALDSFTVTFKILMEVRNLTDKTFNTRRFRMG